MCFALRKSYFSQKIARAIHKRINKTIANAKPASSSAPVLIGRQVGFTVSQEIKGGRNEDRSANTVFALTARDNFINKKIW
jgi:hypothetical protein